MTTQGKISVYLQRQISKHAGCTSAMQSVAGIFNAQVVAYTTAVYRPRKMSVMGILSACKGFDSGFSQAHRFLCACMSKLTPMNNTKTNAAETANTITFKADWLDFTEHLTNAQFGSLARCVAEFCRGGISQASVTELCNDAAVGVAYNFITDQISRRT